MRSVPESIERSVGRVLCALLVFNVLLGEFYAFRWLLSLVRSVVYVFSTLSDLVCFGG